MPLFPINQFKRQRPDWTTLAEAETIELAPGETLAPAVTDSVVAYFILEGRVSFSERETLLEAGAGHVFLVEPREPTTIAAREASRLLRVAEQSPSSTRGRGLLAATPNTRPVPSAQRRGVSVYFDESKTFSPMMLAPQRGGDLLFAANPGAMVQPQVEEIRRHCTDVGRAILALVLPLETQKEIEEFFRDSYQGALGRALRPLSFAVRADIATDSGRVLAEAMQVHWHRELHPRGAKACALMPLRDWDEREASEMYEYLARIAPSRFGIILQWNPNELPPDAKRRRALATLQPWIWAIEYQSRNGFPEACNHMDALGFQGWMLEKL